MVQQLALCYNSEEKRVTYVQNEETLAIAEASTIGILQASEEEFSLLYVSNSSSPEKKSEDNVVFKSLPITRPPLDLLKKFESNHPLQKTVEPQNIHIILSSGSGGRHAEKFFSNALKPLLNHLGLKDDHAGYSVHHTESADSIKDLVKTTLLPRANQGTRQVVILLSGDGGIADIVNGVTAQPPASGYARIKIILIPMGTGNALAHSSGITADETNGLSTLFRGNPQPLPLFKVRFSDVEAIDQKPAQDHDYSIHGAVVCSWGLHAALVADSDTPEYRKHGVERFKMAARENLFPSDGSLPHEYQAKISVLSHDKIGWKTMPSTKHAYVLVTLVSQLEAGFTISPNSTPLEGLLRLVHFGPLDGGGDEIMRIMGLAYQGGKHIAEEAISYEEINGLLIEFQEEEARFRRVCVDGRIITSGVGGTVEVERERLDTLDLFVL